MNKLLSFKKMHEQDKVLFLPNAWDAMSALILAESGFDAIGTTSWGVANSLGYTDGENIPFDDLLRVIKKILSVISIPLTVDIESGYSDSKGKVVEYVMELAMQGVVGINIEDSLKGQTGLQSIEKHAELLFAIRQALNDAGYVDFFINARTDTYLTLEQPLQETIDRATVYANNGANGVFVPGLYETSDIKHVIDSIDSPLNILSLPNLTDINALKNIGVKRFSIGNALSDAVIVFIEQQAEKILEQKNTDILYTGTTVKTMFKDGL